MTENYMSSHAVNALRSYLPESLILRAGDLDARRALAYKFEAKDPVEIFSARVITLAIMTKLVRERPRKGTWNRLSGSGDASVETDLPSPISAYDPKTMTHIERGSHDALFVHTDRVEGIQDAREQLGLAADFIDANPEYRAVPYVVGTTYQELARLGIRMGLREMVVTDIDPKLEPQLRAAHRWTFSISDRPHEFKPAAVYLPTEEFIERFGQNNRSA